MEVGLFTFGDMGRDPVTGRLVDAHERLGALMEEIELADQVGLDVFGLGEHHRPNYVVSSPPVALAAVARTTKNIRLSSAVSVLSSDDPVRVYEQYATLDNLSDGRAELMVGRGSFIESFPLFGYELSDYEKLFSEKLDLFAALLGGGPVSWSGTVRPPLDDQIVYPQVEGGPLKTWIGVGGSPESVVRAVRYGLPMMLAIIGGEPTRFLPFIDLYHRAVAQLGGEAMPLGVHSPGHVAETDEQARTELWPGYKAIHDRIGGERGWGPTTMERFTQEADAGSLYVGSPETVARKIAQTMNALGVRRFDMKYSSGTLGHDKMMKSIELFGTKVAPMVRDLLSAG